ncbi:DUF397 domain-containing protein [Actinophytocola sp.]|uniref:DUF397 domain-containing protein n=1 Tax=Actinophytocola sp. TaxID=1872138 RepID=UPI002ED3E1E9
MSTDLTRLAWRKSSWSSQDGSNSACVEVANTEHCVAVRDSKSPNKGSLILPNSGWTSFLRVTKM